MNESVWKSYNYSGSGLELLDLFQDEPHVFFLDSSLHDMHRGRYSFMGFDPFDVFQCKGKATLSLLKKKFSSYISHKKIKFTPLHSGIVGYLGYDYGLQQEKICLRTEDDLELPDCFFGFYDCILTIDHFAHKLYITSTGVCEKSEYLRQQRASGRLKNVMKKLSNYFNNPIDSSRENFKQIEDEKSFLSFSCTFTKDRYWSAVKKALEYIGQGEIYQMNLSQRFKFDASGYDLDPLEIYKHIRRLSPSHFGGYIHCGDFQIISSSPERFLYLKEGIVQTRPMKGTRPRGQDPYQDKALREEIIHCGKDKAELLMITDLARNDLGRVCDYGSVRVKEMRTIEEYQTVFQATSTIEGALRKDKDCFDLIQACFPGGSITGCPKIRAMEIIEELEPTRRAIYTGSMGYISFSGDMDLNILIRTLLAHRKQIYFQVGGGIVADSTPETEYNETLVKAKAMRTCLESVFLQKNFIKERRHKMKDVIYH